MNMAQSDANLKISLSKVEVRLPGTNKRLFRIQELEIPFGKKVLIKGASGKGKTTLLHLIAGLFVPDEGYVYLGEQRINTLSDEARCRLRKSHYGLIFQKLNLLEHLTALENVMLARSAHLNEERALEALKSVNMLEFANTRCAVLSLGEQQRVAVARVLAAQPEIILADEPTSSLDEANATSLMQALLAAAKGKTLIMVSHDQRITSGFDTTIDFTELIRS